MHTALYQIITVGLTHYDITPYIIIKWTQLILSDLSFKHELFHLTQIF